MIGGTRVVNDNPRCRIAGARKDGDRAKMERAVGSGTEQEGHEPRLGERQLAEGRLEASPF